MSVLLNWGQSNYVKIGGILSIINVWTCNLKVKCVCKQVILDKTKN